ncbi:response regulator [Streptomyces sp. NRRL B-1677]|uniref:DNA-binding response regulator n=1 Tax=Streptomyces klenkii TaxID=1420899 RepID=A0A3B0B001_9ACTN|nr:MULTISPECIES: response regulator transcription factor [Streptomyces]MBF6047091.1 response regulator [Streptomyces sp. NRRL B-1677]RKN65869.1 DNA-binding response regulator [Streptomyces klenkii]
MNIVVHGLSPVIRLGVITALLEASDLFLSEHFTDIGDPEEVHALIREDEIDLVIIDPTQPTLNAGLALCRDIKCHTPAPPVLAFCKGVSPRNVLLSHLSGIDSFVHANESPARLAAAVQSTLCGSREWLIGPLEKTSTRWSGATSLTPREQQVLWLLSERCTNSQIARTLSISANTVKNHVAAVLRKLAVKQRSELFADISLPEQQRYVRG